MKQKLRNILFFLLITGTILITETIVFFLSLYLTAGLLVFLVGKSSIERMELEKLSFIWITLLVVLLVMLLMLIPIYRLTSHFAARLKKRGWELISLRKLFPLAVIISIFIFFWINLKLQLKLN